MYAKLSFCRSGCGFVVATSKLDGGTKKPLAWILCALLYSINPSFFWWRLESQWRQESILQTSAVLENILLAEYCKSCASIVGHIAIKNGKPANCDRAETAYIRPREVNKAANIEVLQQPSIDICILIGRYPALLRHIIRALYKAIVFSLHTISGFSQW